jgi:hypothetical protein
VRCGFARALLRRVLQILLDGWVEKCTECVHLAGFISVELNPSSRSEYLLERRSAHKLDERFIRDGFPSRLWVGPVRPCGQPTFACPLRPPSVIPRPNESRPRADKAQPETYHGWRRASDEMKPPTMWKRAWATGMYLGITMGGAEPRQGAILR